MAELVRYEVQNKVATLTINRPEKRNALSQAVALELTEAFKRAEHDEAARVVVLTGAGKAFSAGADLSALDALQTATPMANREDSAILARLFETIYTLQKPVIAKVNGHAIAGGSGLAAVCDISIVSERAKLGFTEVRIGFVPAIVMVYVLRKIGEADARDLFLTGRLVTASEAAAMRLITEVVAPGALETRVDEVAQAIASGTSRSAVALTKQMLAQVPGMGMQEALSYAIQMNAFARGTADCKAGITAFLTKTAPPWHQ